MDVQTELCRLNQTESCSTLAVCHSELDYGLHDDYDVSSVGTKLG